MQLKDLSRGAFGFVQLCRNKQTGETVAIKFIERGEPVSGGAGQVTQGSEEWAHDTVTREPSAWS